MLSHQKTLSVFHAFLRLCCFHSLKLILFLLFQMDDIDAMFSDLLGEMDDLTNVSALLWRHTETNLAEAFRIE